MGHPEWYCGWATRHPGWWEHNRCRPPAEEPVLSLPKDEAPSSEEYAKMWVISRFKRFLHFFSKSEWVNVFLTSVIAAMSVVGTFLVIQGGKDTARIRDAAEKQACAANKSAQASRDFADTAAKINSGIGDAVGKLDAQAKAIEDSRRSSDSASLQSLNASIESSRLDQRAWVGTGDAVFTFSPPNRLKLKSP